MRLLRLSIAILVAAPAFGLSGRVIDSTGAALAGVTVEASRGGGRAAVAVTERSGRYSLALPPGRYDVAFRLSGFGTLVRNGVASDATLDATLSLASSADVVVTADPDEPPPVAAASTGVITAKEIERRPYQRAGDILETVPGVVVTQHSGDGKANQYYLRGFDLDHGTDIAISVAGVPLNMPTHAHGQGYADANFVIPELIGGVQYQKGPYAAEQGDFASAGAVSIDYAGNLRPLALVQGGMFGYERALVAASPQIGNGFLLLAAEVARNNGPWVRPDDAHKLNFVARYTAGALRVTAMAYDARWSATDQIPQRAVDGGAMPRFGAVDPSDGGTTSRDSLAVDWQRGATQLTAYAVRYKLDLFSDFTYFLDDPRNGDQFEQRDARWVEGVRATQRWTLGRTETVAGLQLRRDDIGTLGLFHTVRRQRIGTTRDDAVVETSGALFAQSTVQLAPRVRAIAGLRADEYRFEVERQASSPVDGRGRPSPHSIASPKLSLVFGPWRGTEAFANAGGGFHSNDARGGTTPLVRTRGAEAGVRSTAVPRLRASAALWALDIGSELVFAGDSGTTEAAGASRRTGVEVAASYDVSKHVALDGEYARSHARFTNGDRIPGAVEGVATAGLSLIGLGRLSGELRYRFFGPRPLVEDNSVRSPASHLVTARTGWALTPHVRVDADVFNALNAKVSDVDYFYVSRLRNEPADGVAGVHFHPVEKRSLRLGVSTTF
jgi:TonB dependent receptor/TonB-dependent Receptor Plug Domain/Carboxypeptidase regulatory-like domain